MSLTFVLYYVLLWKINKVWFEFDVKQGLYWTDLKQNRTP